MPKIVKRSDETAGIIKRLSGLGTPHDQICAIVEISKPTLYKYYQEELNVGKAIANVKVTENLFKIATGTGRGNVTACIFWLKTQCKWKEVDELIINNVAEENDKFKQIVKTIRDTKLSEEGGSQSTH
jgi:hypothetical protein